MALSRRITNSISSLPILQIARRTLFKLQTLDGKEEYFRRLPPEDIQPTRLMPLRGYLYLPGNQDPGMPQYMKGARENFPYALHCQDSDSYTLADWGRVMRDVLEEYLPKFGAVLFRGFPIKDHKDFAELMKGSGYDLMDYKFGSDRRDKANANTFGASIEASPVLMEMHTEGAYMPLRSPVIHKVFFYCHQPCKELFGGETPICKVSDILPKLDPDFLRKVKEKGFTYYRIMAHPNQDRITNWKTRMLVESEEEAEKVMESFGVQWRWNANGSVTYWHSKPGFIKHPHTGEDLFFSQFTTHHKSYCDYVSSYALSDNWEDYAAGTHCVYGDGEEIEAKNLQDFRNAQWSTGVAVPLGKGDIIALDNLDCQHGRLNYHGDRKLYISLTSN